MTFLFEELTSAEQWAEAWPVLVQLRKGLSQDSFVASREALHKAGYRLFGLRAESSFVAVAGALIYPHVSHGNDIWIHDLVTAEDQRSRGYGTVLLQNIEEFAKEQGCFRLCVHTRITNEKAQRFYEEKAGYEKYAFVFQKTLNT